MSQRVAVVTDSTAYLPDGVADKFRVGVVPLRVSIHVSGRSGPEGSDVLPSEVAAALSERHNRVTTSQPTPQALAAAYRAAATALGVDEVVAVHLSGALSGTVAAATSAAATCRQVGLQVTVVDSGSTAMGLGFPVLAAAEEASCGVASSAVVAAAESTSSRTRTMFYVHTLEHLRRGGRIGAAAALLGSALAVKPILHVVEGRIALLEKVRTSARAIARLEELAVGAADGGPVDIAVHHLAAVERADALADRLRERIPTVQALYVSEVGAVVGAHVGPGVLGVVVSSR